MNMFGVIGWELRRRETWQCNGSCTVQVYLLSLGMSNRVAGCSSLPTLWKDSDGVTLFFLKLLADSYCALRFSEAADKWHKKRHSHTTFGIRIQPMVSIHAQTSLYSASRPACLQNLSALPLAPSRIPGMSRPPIVRTGAARPLAPERSSRSGTPHCSR